MALLPFRRATDISITVAPVVAPATADAVAHELRARLGHLAGAWSVTLEPSPHDRQHWRMELRGAPGRQVWLFLATEAALTQAAARVLERHVRRASDRFAASQRKKTAGGRLLYNL